MGAVARHHRRELQPFAAPRVSVRQIRPRPKRAMKLMASGVTWSAQHQVASFRGSSSIQNHHAAGAHVGNDVFNREIRGVI
jgi:hypothetical protein